MTTQSVIQIERDEEAQALRRLASLQALATMVGAGPDDDVAEAALRYINELRRERVGLRVELLRVKAEVGVLRTDLARQKEAKNRLAMALGSTRRALARVRREHADS